MIGWFWLLIIIGLVPCILGAPWIKRFNPRYSFAFAYGTGFFIELAAFHVIAFPATVLYVPFHQVKTVFSVFLLAACGLSCFVFFKDKPFLHELRSKKIGKLNWLEWVLIIAFLFFTGLQLLRGITMDMGWVADDDASYVVMTADVLEVDRMDMVDSYTGVGEPLNLKRFMQTIFWFPAYLSAISGISVATVVHTVQYEQVLVLVYLVYLFMAGEIITGRENRMIFLLIISVFHVFGYHSFYSLTIRVLGPNYHGKAILATALTPLVLALLIKMLSEPYQWKRGALFSILSLAFGSLTLWGLGTCFVIEVIPVVLSLTRKERDWKHLIYLLWGCALPAFMMGYYLYCNKAI